MIYQRKFVFAILMRRSVGWPPQNRDDHRLSLWEAIQAHGEHTLIGLVAGWISYRYVQGFFLWLIPVLAGLVLSIPLSMLSSSTAVGLATRRLGLFLTPEEYEEPRIIQLLKQNLEIVEAADANPLLPAEASKVTDPGACALHLALLPMRPVKKRQRHQLRALIYQLVEEGPEQLSPADRRSLISDPESLVKLHTLAWSDGKDAAG
jgi:membrane glycosyltransferase